MFKFEDFITMEEKAIMYGIARGMEFDKKYVNGELAKARKNKNR
jgi:hypothetical protein